MLNDPLKRPSGPTSVTDDDIRASFRHCDLEWDVMSSILGIALEANDARRAKGKETAHDD
ncbi:MAG: hypothetical protein F9K22_14565 [Bacteroidetes bacterium]|nr:MAG: hypothetical protein F9K22_14565 [Bacteroidota bacterium]